MQLIRYVNRREFTGRNRGAKKCKTRREKFFKNANLFFCSRMLDKKLILRKMFRVLIKTS